MPTRSATRRIERPSGPSSSSSASAAAAISRARGLWPLAALEAIAPAQAVAGRPVESDVEAPGQRTDDERGREGAERDERAEDERPPDPVEEVVRAHRAGVELPALQAASQAGEQGEVRSGPEDGDLPPAAHCEGRGDGGAEESNGENGEGGAAERLRNGGDGVHQFLLGRSANTVRQPS